MPDQPPVVAVESLVRDYGEGPTTRAVDGVNLEIEAREFTSLVGPSGSGKSTLLNIMGLLDRPTSGRVLIHGGDTSRLSDRELTKLRGQSLGFIFQFHHLLIGFSALENVMMPAAVATGSFTAATRERATRLLDQVGLGDLSSRDIRQLSGGQRQRVAIARALTNEPDLVLADEPTGNLDTETADRVMALLERINEQTGTAFLIVTHDEERAERCRRLIRLVDGRITEDRRGTQNRRDR